MKKFLPLFMLAALVSCGGNSGNGKPDYKGAVDQLEAAIRAKAKRGLVTNTVDSGKSNSMECANGCRFVVEEESGSEKEIILKIEGNDMYTLVESYDGLGNYQGKKVELSSMVGDNAEFIKMLEQYKASVSVVNNVMSLSMAVNSENIDKYDTGVFPSVVISLNYDMNTGCDGKTVTQDVSVVGKIDGVVTMLPNYNRTTAVSCGAVLSNLELKNLNLQNIRFCDDRGEDEVCETRDMSWLTSDI